MKNILLIENDDQIIDQVSGSFNDEEYELLVAESGIKGYELALKNLPDIIICNNEIFEALGNEALHQLKADSTFSNIPFIFLVNKNSVKKEKKKTNYGLDYHIIKPFSPSELFKVIQIALEKSDAVSQSSEKKLDELRGSLSFSLPHEFFTPLNGILGFTDVLVNDFDNLNRDEIIQMLQFIHKDARRLKKLTKNFLLFAQLEMISKDPDKVTAIRTSYFINPKEIITASAKLVAGDFDRESDLVLELENGVIRMQEEYLKTLIRELINNAFKFSLEGTPVIVSLLSNDTSVMISITDSGLGMTRKQISSIGAYMQFDREQHEQQGSGLGLIISKKITELHGGSFKIESTPHEGTRISLIFEN
ncbi:MAG: hybrid sensor histidine kinase/response regulator [Ignavibacteriaceae bacterium]